MPSEKNSYSSPMLADSCLFQMHVTKKKYNSWSKHFLPRSFQSYEWGTNIIPTSSLRRWRLHVSRSHTANRRQSKDWNHSATQTQLLRYVLCCYTGPSARRVSLHWKDCLLEKKLGLAFPWSESQTPNTVMFMMAFLSFLITVTKYLIGSNSEDEGFLWLTVWRIGQGAVSGENMGQLVTWCLQPGSRVQGMLPWACSFLPLLYSVSWPLECAIFIQGGLAYQS